VSNALDATRYSRRGAVCSVDPLASSAGLAVLRAGGSAADAAVAASAVLTVTTPHMCGMGGDLLAVVHGGAGHAPEALIAVGSAGSGADAQALRDEGHIAMPMRDDIRSVTVPGCVDGWLALHERYGRLPLTDVLEPARSYAAEGFPVGTLLARALPVVEHVPAARELFAGGAPAAGDLRRRTALGRALADIAADGRSAWYEGAFGAGLRELGAGLFSAEDLRRSCVEWATPLARDVWGQRLHAIGAPTQGYLTLAHLAVLERLGDLPSVEDPAWAHLLVEVARSTGADRPRRLHDGAQPADLLTYEDLDAWAGRVDRERAGAGGPPPGPGGAV
jgi:gamma-glutamyltranspeptidase/glutathione hydrolase